MSWSRRFDARVKFRGIPLAATVVLQPVSGPAVAVLVTTMNQETGRVEVDPSTARALAAGLIEAADKADALADPRQLNLGAARR